MNMRFTTVEIFYSRKPYEYTLLDGVQCTIYKAIEKFNCIEHYIQLSGKHGQQFHKLEHGSV